MATSTAADSLTEEQAEELEVLASIYEDKFLPTEGDPRSFQLKVDAQDDGTGALESLVQPYVVVAVSLPADYPDVPAEFSVDTFANQNFPAQWKEDLLQLLNDCAEVNIGAPMVFTVASELEAGLLERLAAAPRNHKGHDPSATANDDDESSDVENRSSTQEPETNASSTKHMSKLQKRKMWDRGRDFALGDKPRGYDWMDIVKHLSRM